MRKQNIIAALVALISGPALADSEATTLFESGRWGVEHIAFEDGTSACRMQSRRENDLIFFWLDAEGAWLTAGSTEWNAAPREISVEFRIDQDRWTADAIADGSVILVPALRPEFLASVKDGKEISIVSSSGQSLLTYSLEGSGAGLIALLDCWGKLPAVVADPFGSASAADPF